LFSVSSGTNCSGNIIISPLPASAKVGKNITNDTKAIQPKMIFLIIFIFPLPFKFKIKKAELPNLVTRLTHLRTPWLSVPASQQVWLFLFSIMVFRQFDNEFQ
jgi:hypothetical protein